MQQPMKKRIAAAAAAALAAGGLALAGHQAPAVQAATATTTTTGTATTSAAKPGGPINALKAVLDQLVGQGKLSSTQEGEVLTAWQQYQHQHQGPGFGRGPFGGDLQAVATALKLTPQQLQQQLQAGKSIAQVAQAQNVPLQTVKDAIVAAAKSRLDQAVAAGRLTSAQETRQLAALQSSLDQRLNATPGQFRGHGPRPEAAETSEAGEPAGQ